MHTTGGAAERAASQVRASDSYTRETMQRGNSFARQKCGLGAGRCNLAQKAVVVAVQIEDIRASGAQPGR